MRSILDTLSVAQSYDIALMLFLMPHALLGAITAPAAQAAAGSTAEQGGSRPGAENPVHEAIVQEVAAVVRLSVVGRSLDEAAASSTQPQTALHLQAILGALDALQKCASFGTALGPLRTALQAGVCMHVHLLVASVHAAHAQEAGRLPGRMLRPTVRMRGCRWLHDGKEKIAADSRSRPQQPSKQTQQLRSQVALLEAFFELLYRRQDDANGGATVLELLAFASFRCATASATRCHGPRDWHLGDGAMRWLP